MPRFTESNEVEVEIDITPQEYVDSCDTIEVEELVDILIEEGFLSKTAKIGNSEKLYTEKAWEETLNKLCTWRSILTSEEIESIEKIASRL